MDIKKGRYRHFKGGEYMLLDVARHSESGEYIALYHPLYGDGGLWVRPLDMFFENVEIDGVSQPRFAFISEE